MVQEQCAFQKTMSSVGKPIKGSGKTGFAMARELWYMLLECTKENSVWEFNKGRAGVYYYSDGSRYDGNWENDKPNGAGRLYYAAGDQRIYFEGHWKNGARTGDGKILYYNDDKEFANYQNDKRNGSATCYVLDGSYWQGLYVNDQKEGRWECYDKTGYHTETQIYKNGELIKIKTFGKNKRNR